MYTVFFQYPSLQGCTVFCFKHLIDAGLVQSYGIGRSKDPDIMHIDFSGS